MKKNLLCLFCLICCLLPATTFAQGDPKIKIGNDLVSADPISGLKLPYWLNALEFLAPDQNVYGISVMEFTVNGTSLDFSQIINITSSQQVPAGKVWKIESIAFQNSASSITNWGLTGNTNIQATDFIGTTDAKNIALKTNGTERVWVLSGGNVGVGTASPSAKLEVNGSIKIADGTQGVNKVLISDAAGLTNWQTAPTAHGKQRFTSSGSFIVPQGVTTVWINASGGGGGGSGGYSVSGNCCYGGPGGGGAHAVAGQQITVTSGATITVTIGAGGAGGTYGNCGANGGSTSFGALLTVAGGQGCGTAGGTGGTEGAPSFWDSNGAVGLGGLGGGSVFGKGGRGARHTSSFAGTGSGYGGGGGGGAGSSAQSAGAAGSAGFLLVEW